MPRASKPILIAVVASAAGLASLAGVATAAPMAAPVDDDAHLRVTVETPPVTGEAADVGVLEATVVVRNDGEEAEALEVRFDAPAPDAGAAPLESAVLRRRVDLQPGATARVPTRLRLAPPAPGAPGGDRGAVVVRVARRASPAEVLHEEELILARGPDLAVIGPFDNAGRGGFAAEYPPEKDGYRADARYAGVGGAEVRWRPLPGSAIGANGFIDLRRCFERRENVVAYVRAILRTDAPRRARLLLGSDDTLTVWCNGRRVLARDVYRAAAPAQDAVFVELAAGANELLLKIGQGGGGWGLHLDLDDGAGGRPEGVLLEKAIRRSARGDAAIRVVAVGRTGAVLAWRTDRVGPGDVVIERARPGRADPLGPRAPEDGPGSGIETSPGTPKRLVRDPRRTNVHRVAIDGLEPGARYVLHARPGVGERGRTRALAFHTTPPRGRHAVLRLRLLAVVFGNVVEAPDADQPGADAPLGDDRFEAIERELADTARFFFINSGLRVWLDVTTVHDATHRVIPPDTPYGVGYSGGEWAAIDGLLAARGEKASEYDGVLLISCDRRFRNGRWEMPGSGGGTLGPLPPANIGKSGWKAGPPNDHRWLFCHEFHHQIDALYAASGYPELLFNHFQPWDGTAHRHGEHWDGNAFSLREWGGHVSRSDQRSWRDGKALAWRWFVNQWGEVLTVADRDEDGVPDDDPRLPLDERRLGSSDERRDTDVDGLPDLGEAMATIGLEHGLGQAWAGPAEAHRADPRNPDSDGDGVRDGDDEAPVDPVDRRVSRRTVTIDGRIDAGWGAAARLEDEAAKVAIDVHLAWDVRGLVIGLRADRAPRDGRILIDADDDGWYLGGDNIEVRLSPSGRAPAGGHWHPARGRLASVAFHNAGVPGRWPFYDAAGFRDGELRAEQRTGDDGWSVELLIPAKRGLEARIGERIGLLLAVTPSDGPVEDGRALTLFEPHRSFGFELVCGPH